MSFSSPPPVLLFINSRPQGTPGESSQPPPHGATTSTVRLGPSSKSSGLARPSNTQSWYLIPPLVLNARRGTSFRVLKESPPSEYFSVRPHRPFQLIAVSTSGSITINNVQYKWKAKGTGSKLVVCQRSTPSELNPLTSIQLVNTKTKAVVVESHHRIAGGGSFLRNKTPRHMNLDIADEVIEHTELILLTFLLVWKERVGERAKTVSEFRGVAPDLAAVLMN